MAAAAIGGAVLGGIGGAIKKGNALQLSDLGQQAQGYAGSSLSAYNNLVNAGPGASDVTAATNATRNYAGVLGNYASTGLYDMAQGNNLAAQQFAGQRTALEQTFQSQLQSANQQAALAGRGANDPILRARLAQTQSLQQAQLNANQSSAALSLGRQSATDQISLLGQQAQQLQGLGAQAFQNQSSLFGMANSTLQSERNYGLQQAQYDMSRGGGFQGALTGAIGGAAAGFSAGQGLASMGSAGSAASSVASAGAGQAAFSGSTAFNPSFFSGANPYASTGSGFAQSVPSSGGSYSLGNSYNFG